MWGGRWRRCFAAMFSLVATSTSACADATVPSLTITYKQTVIFEGPAGTVEVSGVFQEVARYSAPVIGVPAHISKYLLGEALGTEIPAVGYVVQSLVRRSGDLAGTIVSEACGIASPDVKSAEEAAAWLAAVDLAFAVRCSLPVSSSQIVLVLADPAQPATGIAYFPDRLPSGLRIKSIILERTTEPITRDRLPNFWRVAPGSPAPVLPLVPDDGSVFILVEDKFTEGE